jgi:hypothetical protein
MSTDYGKIIDWLDSLHEDLLQEALLLRDEFLAEAKSTGKIQYRTVQVKVNTQRSVSILWKRVTFTPTSKGLKAFTVAIPKGKAFSYRAESVVKNADYWLQELFHAYEPKFAIIRESLLKNMKARKALLELQQRVNANPPIRKGLHNPAPV